VTPDTWVMNSEIEREEIDLYLSGEKLYGDNLGPEEVREWITEEQTGYYNLGAGIRKKYVYGYHSLNWRHAFSWLPRKDFSHVLGVGSAYGDELLPLIGTARRITILDPGFHATHVGQFPVEYAKPENDGGFPFEDRTFDLITCFSVLHHLPNVRFLIREMYRCLAPGGFALLREPIISLGDWRKPRKGITKHQRGIPLDIFRELVTLAGFRIVRERLCTFSLMSRFRYFVQEPVYNVQWCVALDEWLCGLPLWSHRYHPRFFWHKLRPWSVAYVLQRPEGVH
jgi:SAM-dependent methyltransferase